MPNPLTESPAQKPSWFERTFCDANLNKRQKKLKGRQQLRFFILVFPLMILAMCFSVDNSLPLVSTLSFFAAGVGMLVHTILCMREGAVLDRGPGFTERRNSPVVYWMGIFVHFLIAAAMIFAAFVTLFGPHQNHTTPV